MLHVWVYHCTTTRGHHITAHPPQLSLLPPLEKTLSCVCVPTTTHPMSVMSLLAGVWRWREAGCSGPISCGEAWPSCKLLRLWLQTKGWPRSFSLSLPLSHYLTVYITASLSGSFLHYTDLSHKLPHSTSRSYSLPSSSSLSHSQLISVQCNSGEESICINKYISRLCCRHTFTTDSGTAGLCYCCLYCGGFFHRCTGVSFTSTTETVHY